MFILYFGLQKARHKPKRTRKLLCVGCHNTVRCRCTELYTYSILLPVLSGQVKKYLNTKLCLKPLIECRQTLAGSLCSPSHRTTSSQEPLGFFEILINRPFVKFCCIKHTDHSGVKVVFRKANKLSTCLPELMFRRADRALISTAETDRLEIRGWYSAPCQQYYCKKQ
jgi:hypothetical protein